MANLFEKATKKAPAKKAAAEKTQVTINNAKFHKNLAKMVELQKKIAEMNAEVKMIDGEIREEGIEQFVKLYDETGKYPGSFEIVATGAKNTPNAQYMFLPTDRYIKIDEERAGELEDQYGEGIVTVDTKFVMDAKLIEKYGDELSAAIEGCDGIPTEDKERLISAAVSYSVSKGTIKEIQSLEGNTQEILEDIRPVYQVKNVKISE